MEDSLIIELYFQRSESAISESDRKYGRYCGAIARGILKNDEDAEECVSDTWLRAWNAIPPTVPKILRAFFGRITRNLSLNRYEKEHADMRGGGEVPLVLDELAECVADAQAGTWSAEQAVLKDTLNAFLGELPEEHRKIFVRRYFYMDTIPQIAEDFGCGESRVKMLLMRARGRLAERLKEEGIEV